MKKTSKVINDWKLENSRPGNIVFNIQIDKKDFDEMVKEIEQLQTELSLLCPIGDLSVIESLKAEKLMYMKEVDKKENEIQRLYGKLNMIQDLLSSI